MYKKRFSYFSIHPQLFPCAHFLFLAVYRCILFSSEKVHYIFLFVKCCFVFWWNGRRQIVNVDGVKIIGFNIFFVCKIFYVFSPSLSKQFQLSLNHVLRFQEIYIETMWNSNRNLRYIFDP